MQDYSRSPNPHRLYRNRRDGVISGVCAGVADYFNVDVVLVRAGTVIAAVVFSVFTILGYILLAIVVPTRPEPRQTMAPEEDTFWRGVERRPEATFSNIRYRFRDLDERLQDIERVVTSDEWRLRRQFRELEDR